MSIGGIKQLDGEVTLFYRDPSWEPAGRDAFSHYDELRTDTDVDTYAYSRLLQSLKDQQTKEDQEVDRQANERAARLKQNLQDTYNRVIELPPIRGVRRQNIIRAMATRIIGSARQEVL